MSEAGTSQGRPADETEPASRLFVSPRARRLARDRGLNLAHVRGSGPRGRIVAADVEPIPESEASATGIADVSALSIEFSTVPAAAMLTKFSRAGLSIDFGDVLIRAASAALSVVLQSDGEEGRVVGLELAGGTLRFDDASAMSLSAIHQARSENPRIDPSRHAAALSISVLHGAVSPILLPLLPGYRMRLVLAFTAGNDRVNCTLFYSGEHSAEFASSILESLKRRLEEPALLLL